MALVPEYAYSPPKTKEELRKLYNVKSATSEYWIAFQQHVSQNLPIKDHSQIIPSSSPLPFAKLKLNAKWYAFKTSVIEAADASIEIDLTQLAYSSFNFD